MPAMVGYLNHWATAAPCRHWTVDDYKHVAWSGESRIEMNRADGRVRVWRQPHESMDPTYTTLTGDRYVSILYYHLHSFMYIMHSDGLGKFQPDNETPHTSRIATEGLLEHSSEFRHFRSPPNCTDMNIIVHIWDVLQRAVQKRSSPPLILIYGHPYRIRVSVTSSTTSDINRIHATSCCGISSCSWGFYMILGRFTSFFGSSVYIHKM
ncbi:transposable element Tcb2 transposase [Trichonephila clavipes]|nr:transposable element Tcb2 transposase [Trichonephila clavipes]